MAEWFDDFFFTYQTLIYHLGINGILGLSMYVVLAVGQLSLGQAAFMGIGAYMSSLITLKAGLPFPAAAVSLPCTRRMTGRPCRGRSAGPHRRRRARRTTPRCSAG